MKIYCLLHALKPAQREREWLNSCNVLQRNYSLLAAAATPDNAAPCFLPTVVVVSRDTQGSTRHTASKLTVIMSHSLKTKWKKSVSHPCICYLACYVMLCLLWVNQVKSTSLILVTLVSGDPASIPALGDLWPAHLANYYHSPQHNWKLKETLQSDAALPVVVVVLWSSA